MSLKQVPQFYLRYTKNCDKILPKAFRGGPFHGGHQPRHHHQQQSPHWNRGRGGGFTPRGHGQNFVTNF